MVLQICKTHFFLNFINKNSLKMKKQQNFAQPAVTSTYAGEFAGQAKY